KLDLPDPFRPMTRVRPGPGGSSRVTCFPTPRKPSTVIARRYATWGSGGGAFAALALPLPPALVVVLLPRVAAAPPASIASASASSPSSAARTSSFHESSLVAATWFSLSRTRAARPGSEGMGLGRGGGGV